LKQENILEPLKKCTERMKSIIQDDLEEEKNLDKDTLEKMDIMAQEIINNFNLLSQIRLERSDMQGFKRILENINKDESSKLLHISLQLTLKYSL